MRAHSILLLILLSSLVNAAPHITIAYEVTTEGSIQILSVQGEDIVAPIRINEGDLTVTWSAYSANGARTALIPHTISFGIIFDDYEHGQESRYPSRIVRVSIPVRSDTERIIAMIDDRLLARIDLIDLACTGSCPTCANVIEPRCGPLQAEGPQSSPDPRISFLPVLLIVLALIGTVIALILRKRHALRN